MWKTSHIDHSQKTKNLLTSLLSLQLSEHSCHSRDIHTIYAELLTPGGLLYVPSLSVVINLSFSASIGLPFIWCRRRCLGERFARELHRKKTNSRERKKTKQDKGNHISFCNFTSHSIQGWTPMPVPSKTSLPQPSFSSLSQVFMPVPHLASNLSSQASPNNTLVGSISNSPIPSNSLKCHLPFYTHLSKLNVL